MFEIQLYYFFALLFCYNFPNILHWFHKHFIFLMLAYVEGRTYIVLMMVGSYTKLQIFFHFLNHNM